ncbi:MAG: membrane protein [Alphaproteobacteria bacterium]|nr:MAG: membrane protein [Alphaproteobacteria bacterium]
MASPGRRRGAATGGTLLRPAHFPGRAPLEAYGNGGFRFAGMSHRGSLLCLPSGIYAWRVDDAAQLSLDSFSRVLAEAADIEVLLVGTGGGLAPLRPEWRQAFRDHGISADAMSTGAAVRTFNVLLAEGRAVAAALVAVE